MRLVLVALAVAFPAAASAQASPPPGLGEAAAPARICRDWNPRQARTPGKLRPRRLGELPPADLTRAVLNRVGDCIEPVIVRQGIGAVGR